MLNAKSCLAGFQGENDLQNPRLWERVWLSLSVHSLWREYTKSILVTQM